MNFPVIGDSLLSFPIDGVPISIEVVSTKAGKPQFVPARFPSAAEARHWAGTLVSVWSRIPAADRGIIVADVGKYTNKRLSILSVEGWRREWRTNAFFLKDNGIIGIDAGYARLADPEHLGATLAHEFAHLLDLAAGNEGKLTEPAARQIAEGNWGFPRGEVIYRCERCRMIDAALRKRGITGGVFWEGGTDCYVYIKSKRRIRFGASYHLLNHSARNSLINVLDSELVPSFESPEARGRFMRRRIKRRKMG